MQWHKDKTDLSSPHQRICNLANIRDVMVTCLLIVTSTFWWTSRAQPVAADAESNSNVVIFADSFSYQAADGQLLLQGNVAIYVNDYRISGQMIRFDEASGQLFAEQAEIQRAGQYLLQADYAEFNIYDYLGGAEGLNIRLAGRQQIFANKFRRLTADRDQFNQAAYTTCEICEQGTSIWLLRSDEVIVDRNEQRIFFYDTVIDFYKVPILYLPYLSIPDPAVERATGLLAPRLLFSRLLGSYIEIPYYFALAEDKDLTVQPLVALAAQYPVVAVEYRQDFANSFLNTRGWLVPSAQVSNTEHPFSSYIRGDYTHHFPAMITADLDIAWMLNNDYHPLYSLYQIRSDLLDNKLRVYQRFPQIFWQADARVTHDLASKQEYQIYDYALPAIRFAGWWQDQLGGQTTVSVDGINNYRNQLGRQLRISTGLDYDIEFYPANVLQLRNTVTSRVDFYAGDYDNEYRDVDNVLRVLAGAGVELAMPILITNSSSDNAPDAATDNKQPLYQIFKPHIKVNYLAKSEPALIQNFDTNGIINNSFATNEINSASGHDVVAAGLRIDYGINHLIDFTSGSATLILGQSWRYFPTREKFPDRLTPVAGLSGLLLGSDIRSDQFNAFALLVLADPDRRNIGSELASAYVDLDGRMAKVNYGSRYTFQAASNRLGISDIHNLNAWLEVGFTDNWSSKITASFDLLRDFKLSRIQSEIRYVVYCFDITVGVYSGFDDLGIVKQQDIGGFVKIDLIKLSF